MVVRSGETPKERSQRARDLLGQREMPSIGSGPECG